MAIPINHRRKEADMTHDDIAAAAAVITVEVLRWVREKHTDITPEIIGSAFADAYRGVQLGLQDLAKDGPARYLVPPPRN